MNKSMRTRSTMCGVHAKRWQSYVHANVHFEDTPLNVMRMWRFYWIAAFFMWRYVDTKRWTEEDEARRIQQLKEAEQLEFQLEQQSQVDSRVLEGTLSRKSDIRFEGETSFEERPGSRYLLKRTEEDILVASTATTPSEQTNWCYHCATPLSRVHPNLRRAIEMLLSLRRTSYPSDVVTAECTEPKNLSQLAIEQCRHPHCQTLILTDHDAGSAFTIRGCAERFGAINERMLEARGDNTCQRLHDKLDIQECICRYRKYCYPGAERAFFSGERSQ
uniref:Protein Wnt n=2 Tax=Parascaris univalens TaxID=6257 RepID=A0A915B0Y4_PARUN